MRQLDTPDNDANDTRAAGERAADNRKRLYGARLGDSVRNPVHGIALAMAVGDRHSHGETVMQRIVLAALLLVAISGCVIVGDPTCGGSAASLVVAPGVVVVSVGQSFTPNGSESWCDSGHQAHGSPSWSLSQPSDGNVIALDASTGRITGLKAGIATVVATSAHSSATSEIVVTVK